MDLAQMENTLICKKKKKEEEAEKKHNYLYKKILLKN